MKRRTSRLLDKTILLVLVTSGVLLLYHSFSSLNYKWNWQAILQFFFRYSESGIGWVPGILVEGFLTTIRISIWSSLVALVFGVTAGLMLRAEALYPRLLARTYVEFVRNLPPLVLIFLFYFFFSSQIMTLLNVDDFIATRSEGTRRILGFLFAEGNQFSAFVSALFTLALYEGAYIAEIVRAGLNSVPRGQWEAADALGFGVVHKYRFIILPQAVKIILPALAGQLISTIKDSAIISVISVQELTFQGMELMSATYLTFETWITITVMYFVLTYSCSLGAGRLEKKLNNAGDMI